MDYTQSDAYVTDGGTGNPMHQSTAPITTEVSSDDVNGLTWELLELIKGAGVIPAAFDKAVPASYSQVREAVAIMIRNQSGAINVRNSPWFAVGDGRPSDIVTIRDCIEANPGKVIFIPNGIYGDGTDILYLTVSTLLLGERMPTFNFTTMEYEHGTVIKAVIAGAGNFAGVGFRNLGVDSQNIALTEGISLAGSGAGPVRNVLLENVTVAAHAASNHTLLIEHATNVHGRNIEVIGGGQGLAVKAENIDIKGVRSFDNGTWGVTVRYTPGAPSLHGSVSDVLCANFNNAKGGGFICMNSQEGAALRDFTFDNIRVINGGSGVYVDNSSNTVPADNLKFSRIYVEGVDDFAIQTFGPVKNGHFDDVTLKNCAGSIYNNGALAVTDMTYSDFKLENVVAPALLSGSRHIARNWKKIGGTGGFFIENESTGLQVYDMDANVTAVINLPGGTTTGIGDFTKLIATNGALPARVIKFNQTASESLVMSQNDYLTLYALPDASSCVQMDLHVITLSSAGYRVRRINISDTVITYGGTSTFAANVFEIDRSGPLIRLKYIWDIFAAVGVATEVVYVDFFYTVSHES